MGTAPRSRFGAGWTLAKAAYQAARDKLKLADEELDQAEASLLEAQSQRDRQQDEMSGEISGQAELVGATRGGRGRLVGSWGAVEVYEWWIVTPEGEGPARGTQAIVSRTGDLTTYNTVDVKVNKKGGLGGATAGALIAGPVGAVIGFGLRRKTEVKTTNKPTTVDTRAEMVQIFSKSFAYTAHFSGWGSGTALANAVNRQARVTSSPKQELAKRSKALDGLKARSRKAAQVHAKEIKAREADLKEAWVARGVACRTAEKRWGAYSEARPGSIKHVALALIPLSSGFHPASALLALCLGATFLIGISGNPGIGPEVIVGLAITLGLALLGSLAWMRGFGPRQRSKASD